MLSTSSQGLAASRSQAGGSLTVHLGGRFRQLSVARIGADGHIEQECIGPGDVQDEEGSGAAERRPGSVPGDSAVR